MNRLIRLIVVLFLLAISIPAAATIYEIPVTNDGDRVWMYEQSSGGTWDVDASPNVVSLSGEVLPGTISMRGTALTFDLSSIKGTIVSASLNLNILSKWKDPEHGNPIGYVYGMPDGIPADPENNIERVLAEAGQSQYPVGIVYDGIGGLGWTSFEVPYSGHPNSVTKYLQSIQVDGATVADFYVVSANPGGFTISSAEGEQPAFLRITTTTPTPIPAAVWLFGTGLLGLFGVRRKIRR
jgi:hypothetical protein